MHLTTSRLLVRDLVPLDAIPLAELWTDPDVTLYMGGPRDYETIRVGMMEDAEIHKPTGRDDLWPTIDRASGELVGHCGLLEKEVDGKPEVELIYVLVKDAWGKGLAAEAATALRDYAFEHLKLPRLIALVDPDNKPSARVAEKVGMRLEKEVVRPDGKRRLVYAMFRGASPHLG